MREPNFDNILKVLRRQEPERPVLYELFMNGPLYELVNGHKPEGGDDVSQLKFTVEAFRRMGYDYTSVHASSFHFSTREREHKKTVSLNDGAVIESWADFEKYEWPDPENCDTSKFDKIRPFLPDGMKLKLMGPGGVLENVIALTGYDTLCYMMFDDPTLAQAIFDHVGDRLVRYYKYTGGHDTIGFICSNDDWGFNTQTFLSPDQMKKYVFPWHRKIVEAAHSFGKPVMLHSCGCFRDIMADTIALGYDAKHSYEDNIMPVEEVYEQWHDRIAILGGIDMNFIVTKSEEEVYARARAMLERVKGRGGYALGTGNSVPEYITYEKFRQIIRAATGQYPDIG